MRFVTVALLIIGAGAVGCFLIQPLPPGSNGGNDAGGINGSSSGGGGNSGGSTGSTGSTGGTGGTGSTGDTGTTGTKTFTYSNQSSKNLSLSYQIDGGVLATINLNSSQTFVVNDVPACACFTQSNFTPPGSAEVEGFSIQTCANAQADFTNTLTQPPGVTVAVSGGGAVTGHVTINVENTSSHILTLFPTFNGKTQSQITLAKNTTQSITVDHCIRLRVLARDSTNSAVQAEFVIPAVTDPQVWICRDLNATQIEFVQQAS